MKKMMAILLVMRLIWGSSRGMPKVFLMKKLPWLSFQKHSGAKRMEG